MEQDNDEDVRKHTDINLNQIPFELDVKSPWHKEDRSTTKKERVFGLEKEDTELFDDGVSNIAIKENNNSEGGE